MCGICGLLTPHSNPVATQESLWRMNARLVHRGPDDEGYFVEPGVGLAACRLSIIDVAGGHQPLSNEEGTVWITYNGEIYNHEDLRARLLRVGHRFRTRSDTEMVVHAYEEWGEACVSQFRGMFAFAIWDAPRQRLVLARDRFGKKPLYYAFSAGRFLFGSEAKALLAEGTLAHASDLDSLRQLFMVGFVSSPGTMFREIRKLPAAHVMIIEVKDGGVCQPQMQRYWDLPLAPPRPASRTKSSREALIRPAPNASALSRPETIEQVRHLLRESVSIRRMSEVPLGALLSGGLDSTIVVALLQTMSDTPIHTVSIAFENGHYDESAHARLAAETLGTQHHVLSFGERDFDLLPKAVKHLEEPQCSATSLPIYLLYKACRDAAITVVLTGEGSDELFAGYHWYRGDATIQKLLPLPSVIRRGLARSPVPMSRAARNVLASANGDHSVAERYALWQRVLSPAALGRLLALDEGQHVDDTKSALGSARSLSRLPGSILNVSTSRSTSGDPRSAISEMRHVESHTRMVDFINFEVDRLSMAHSIEARMPFLDHLLWEFVCQLPQAWMIRGRREKSFLREVAAPWVPRKTLRRAKWGLAAPHADWLRNPRLPAWAEEAFHPAALEGTGYFRPAEVARLRGEHQSHRADHSRALLGVLSTQIWHQEFRINNLR